MSEQTKFEGDVEALEDLLRHRGWHIVREAILKEVEGEFQSHITAALDRPDEKVALDLMRQTAAVRKAGLRWLDLPKERLNILRQQGRANTAAQRPDRRPVGV